MSNKNYSKQFNKTEKASDLIPTASYENEVVETPEEVIPETVESKIYGVVVNCSKLNIRQRPSKNAEVLFEANIGTEFLINESASTNEWYNVCSSEGVEGFCMKTFIKIK